MRDAKDNFCDQLTDSNHVRWDPTHAMWEGNVFTPACQSFCSQGVYPFPLGRYPFLGRHNPLPLDRHHHPQADTPRANIPPPARWPQFKYLILEKYFRHLVKSLVYINIDYKKSFLEIRLLRELL